MELLVHSDQVWELQPTVGLGKEESIGISRAGQTTPSFQKPGGDGLEIGRSEMDRSQVRRGQMLTLKSFNFC